MKKIINICNLNHTDANQFIQELDSTVRRLQIDGQEVEIQYSTDALHTGQIVLSALVLGRKEL